MSSQAEEHRTSQAEDGNDHSADALQTRVSELLDNATVTPDDDLPGAARLEQEVGERAGGYGRAAGKDDARADDASEGTNASGTRGSDVVLKHDDANEHSKPDALDNDHPNAEEAATDVGKIGPGSEANNNSGIESNSSSDPAVEASENRVESDAQADLAAEHSEEVGAAPEGDETTGGQDEQKPVEQAGISPATVRIRGRPGGVLVEVEQEGEWQEILELLEERLAAAEGFFRGGKAVIEVGPRDVYEDELRRARDLLARHDMTLAIVRSTSDLTLQSSLLLGLSTSNEAERSVEPDREMAPVVPITQPKSPYFVHNGTLRSGQVLRKAESIVVVGDVNPGAKVISGGDVMVWGRLRGMAYAGAGGNRRAMVAAIEFSPTQLRIATVTAVPPDPPKSRRGLKFWKKEPERRPEVAHIADGRIVVEPWDDSRPGRPRIARR